MINPGNWLRPHDLLLERYGPQLWWPGETPFEVMVGAVLTQNTAWSNVEKAIANLKRTERLGCRAILALPEPELAELIRPAGYFNVKARRLQALCRFLEQNGAADAPESLGRSETQDAVRCALLTINGSSVPFSVTT